jgi:cytochrome c oxidase subunit 3/cytochrome o ubiquinol oxidase subunit 3
MAGLIVAESAIFTIFVVAYLFYLGKSITGPTPREVLETPIFYTICLLSSSLTIHLAAKFLARGITFAFLAFWLLTISTNLFGTTYYSLVGLHGFHVTAGLIMLTIVAVFGLSGRVGVEQSGHIEVLSMYWHFVDAVWVVVFTVVYVLGR